MLINNYVGSNFLPSPPWSISPPPVVILSPCPPTPPHFFEKRHAFEQTQEAAERASQVEAFHNQTDPVLPPSHPRYNDACFFCRREGHQKKECCLYQCPKCLCFTPGHPQTFCHRGHRSPPPPIPSSPSRSSHCSCSFHNSCSDSLHLPSEILTFLRNSAAQQQVNVEARLCNAVQTVSTSAPTSDFSDDVFNNSAYANMTESPVGGFTDI